MSDRINTYNRVKQLRIQLRLPTRGIVVYPKGSLQYWKTEEARLNIIIKEQKEQEQKEQEQKEQTIDEEELIGNINDLLNDGKFQEVINLSIEYKYELTDDMIDRLFKNIMKNNQHNKIEITTANKNVKYLLFNDNVKEYLRSLLSKGFEEDNVETFGSDALNEIDINEIVNIVIIPLTAFNFNDRDRDGGFFSYVNTTDLDLSKYQIFNQEQAYDKDVLSNIEHCLIHTLIECGIDKAMCNEVKLSFVNGYTFKKKNLNEVANIIKHDIKLSFYDNNKNRIEKTTFKYDSNGSNASIEIGLYQKHYFINEDTEYSSYYINNYDETKLINDSDAKNIIRIDVKNDNKYYRKHETKQRINSIGLIHSLYKSNYFVKMDLSKFKETASNIDIREFIYLENINNEQKSTEDIQLIKTHTRKQVINEEGEIEYVYTPKEVINKNPAYADCETVVCNGDHKLLLIGYTAKHMGESVIINNTVDKPIQQVVNEFLGFLKKNNHNVCYFHNVKYDYTILEPYLHILKKCAKDGQVYSVKVKYQGFNIELIDSFKIIPIALSKFNSNLNLSKDIFKKEAIAYEYYTKENHNKLINPSVYREFLSNDDKMIFDNEVKNYTIKDESGYWLFNPTDYYMDYLKLDCLTLMAGMEAFESIVDNITNGDMSIYRNLTISSLTDNYMVKREAYNGIYELKANIRNYVVKAIYGGRVCVNKKYLKKVLHGKISDYDGVSLYPSAIFRLCQEKGLPCGMAKRYNTTIGSEGGSDCDGLSNWKNKVYSILTIKITSVGKIQQMPMIAVKNENQSIDYVNEPPRNNDGTFKELIIDSITLEDYIKFHKIEYELVDGIYWDSGTNKIMGSVIEELFNERLKQKKLGNDALANVIKLMLNSSYGKNGMKKSKTQLKIIKASQKNFDNYIFNNFNTIKNYRQINKDCYEFETVCVDNSYNRGHIACAILSMSKRIMNEVFDVANDNNIPIYYTDTDSIHMNYDDITKLETEYRKIYNRELNGTNLGQFHTDFNLSNAGRNEEIYATTSIFLGKKSYLDVLESKDKNGNTITGFHKRLKGITEAGLDYTAKKYKDNLLGLYTALANGDKIDIVLNPKDESTGKNKVLFEFGKGRVSTKREFKRMVSF